MLSSMNTVKLADFGLARIRDEHSTNNMTYAGTPKYMAPEIVKMKYDEKADLYALGVMIFELSTKKYPQTPKDKNLSNADLNSIPPFYSPKIRALCMGLIQPLPKTRLSTK